MPNDDEIGLVLMGNKKKEHWKRLIAQRSERAKACIHRWVLLAKYNLNPDLLRQELDNKGEGGEDSLNETDSIVRNYRANMEDERKRPSVKNETPMPPTDKGEKYNQDEVVEVVNTPKVKPKKQSQERSDDGPKEP